MSDGTIRPVLAGQKALVIGIANEELIAYGCAKAFRTVGADLAITWLNDKAKPMSSRLRESSSASITGALDVAVPGQMEAMFDHIAAKLGANRHPRSFDRLCAKGRSAGRPPELLGRGVCEGDGRLVPFVRSHGEARGAVDDRGRDHVRNELLRRQPSGRELQRHGSGQGGAGSVVPLSGL